MDDGRARSNVLALEIHICKKKNKIDPPIRTEYCLSGGATTLIFVVGGSNSVGFFVMRAPISGNMTGTYEFTRMSTSHFMMFWKEVSWTPLALMPMKLAGKKTLVQWKRSASFCSRSELSVVVDSNVAKFLFDTTTDLLLGGREKSIRAQRRSSSGHCKDTASQIPMKGGVKQSVIFVGGHCLQYIATRIHHNARRPSRSGQRQDRLATYMACTLNISNTISVMRSR